MRLLQELGPPFMLNRLPKGSVGRPLFAHAMGFDR
ncbi:MAG: hypothetical protein QOK29_2875 [Rhodospirillaceae bacterium]|nr:hypothetical protein [Rhodospirillaceae bacterium]